MKTVVSGSAASHSFMQKILSSFTRPLERLTFRRLFPITLALLSVIVLAFVHPGTLDGTDFHLIAYDPGRLLLTTGSIPAGYPYPMWTLVVMLPLVLLPLPVGELVWLICNLLMLSAAVTILLTSFDWKLSLARVALIVVLSGFFIPVLSTVWIGQLTIFSFLMLALVLHFYLKRQYMWLGVVLALSMLKPQVTILLTGLILLSALWQRHFRAILSFAITLGLLTLVSLPFISSPAQLIGGGISSHLSTYITRTCDLWGFLMALGAPWVVPAVLCLVLLGWLLISWVPLIRGRSLSSDRVIFLFSFAVLVNLLVIPYSWMHNITLALLAYFYCFFLVGKLSSRPRRLWFLVLFIVMHPLTILTVVLLSFSVGVQSMYILPTLIHFAIFLWLHYRYAPSLLVEPRGQVAS